MFSTSMQLDQKSHRQPRLTALLTSGRNIMPLSWHMPISKSPLKYAVAVREENYSHKLIKESREFGINFLDISYQNAFEKSGRLHGGYVDKYKECGLTPKKGLTMQSHLIEEAYMMYECSVHDVISYGDHTVFIGDVNFILNKETTQTNATLFLGKGYYETLSGTPRRIERSLYE